MSTPAFVRDLLNQTLVYWANPDNDGYNAETFDAPIEIPGRCEFITEMIMTEKGEEVVSKAHVYLDRVLSEGEYLYLGCLNDLDSAPIPSTVEKSMEIVAFSEIPDLENPSEFVYKAFLNKPYLNR